MLTLSIGTSEKEEPAKWRDMLVNLILPYASRLHSLASGVLWVELKYVNVDYSEYLGPDWKPSFEGAGIQVANHQSWLDIMIQMWTGSSSFVSKEEVRNYPGIGTIASL